MKKVLDVHPNIIVRVLQFCSEVIISSKHPKQIVQGANLLFKYQAI